MNKIISILGFLSIALLSNNNMANTYSCPASKEWTWTMPAAPKKEDKNPTPKWTGVYIGSVKWPNIEVKMRIDHVYNTRPLRKDTPIIPALILEDNYPQVKDLGGGSWNITCKYKLGDDGKRNQFMIQVDEAGLRTTSITVNHKKCTKGDAHHQAAIKCE